MSDEAAGPTDLLTRPLNPFSSRFVRPGAIEYRFEDGPAGDRHDAEREGGRAAAHDVASIVDSFYAAGRRGAVVGPHGSGKTTLLAALEPAIAARGDQVRVITLRDRGAGFPRLADLCLRRSTVLFVDGYEQLGWWRRFRLRRAVERAGAGLLVTAHAPIGRLPLAYTSLDLPTLYSTTTTPASAARLVRRLLQERAPSSGLPIDDAEIARRLAAHGGDMRELFFGLYDLYESHRS
jgi:hypothetical protein